MTREMYREMVLETGFHRMQGVCARSLSVAVWFVGPWGTSENPWEPSEDFTPLVMDHSPRRGMHRGFE